MPLSPAEGSVSQPFIPSPLFPVCFLRLCYLNRELEFLCRYDLRFTFKELNENEKSLKHSFNGHFDQGNEFFRTDLSCRFVFIGLFILDFSVHNYMWKV